MADRNQVNESIDQMLTQDVFTPEELSDLMGIGVETIETAVFGGQLRATVINHQILGIERSDALQWLRERDAAIEDAS